MLFVHQCSAKSLSCVRLFCHPMGCVACQAPLSVGFPRQEYWSGLPFPTPGDLPNPGIKPTSLRSPALASRFFTTSATWEALFCSWVLSCFSCVQLCNPMNHGLPGTSVHGILQARILEWVAISFFRISSWPRDQTLVSYVSCFGKQILYHCTTWEAYTSIKKKN